MSFAQMAVRLESVLEMVLNYLYCGASSLCCGDGRTQVSDSSSIPALCRDRAELCPASAGHCLQDKELPQNCIFLGASCCSRMRSGTFGNVKQTLHLCSAWLDFFKNLLADISVCSCELNYLGAAKYLHIFK